MWLTYLAAKAEVPGLNQAHERDIEGGGTSVWNTTSLVRYGGSTVAQHACGFES